MEEQWLRLPPCYEAKVSWMTKHERNPKRKLFNENPRQKYFFPSTNMCKWYVAITPHMLPRSQKNKIVPILELGAEKMSWINGWAFRSERETLTSIHMENGWITICQHLLEDCSFNWFQCNERRFYFYFQSLKKFTFVLLRSKDFLQCTKKMKT